MSAREAITGIGKNISRSALRAHLSRIRDEGDPTSRKNITCACVQDHYLFRVRSPQRAHKTARSKAPSARDIDEAGNEVNHPPEFFRPAPRATNHCALELRK